MPIHNPYINRTGPRAISEIKIRNTYEKNFGIQYYLIVEGESDERFFENILDCEKCKVRNVEGKDNVKNFIMKQNKTRKKGYLGVVDADFEHITHCDHKIDNVIMTDVHDIEMLILRSKPNMRKIYSEMTENIIINNYEKTHSNSYVQSVINAAYEIGLLKLVMKRPKYEIDMSDIPYIDIVDDSFSVNLDELINRIKGNRHTQIEIKNEVDIEKGKKHDQYQICCGHDVTSILAISFIAKEHEGLGYGKRKKVHKNEIEELLRVCYDFELFKFTAMYNDIIEWERKNGIEILDRCVLVA